MAVKIQGTTIIDDSRNVTNLNDLSASGDINFTSNESLKIPSGTTAERPVAPTVGELRFNTDENSFERYNGTSWNKVRNPIAGSLDKTFTVNEEADVSLDRDIDTAPVVSVTKEVPQIGLTNSDWDVAADGSNFTLHDTAYDTTLTPSNATGNGTFTLGSGSFASTDVGKRIEGNGGVAFLTATDGSYNIDTAFNDTSTIAAGDWSMFGLDVESADAGLTLSRASIINTQQSINTLLGNSQSFTFDLLSDTTDPIKNIYIVQDNVYIVDDNSNINRYQFNKNNFELELVESVDFSNQLDSSKPAGIHISDSGDLLTINSGDGVVGEYAYQYPLNTPFSIQSFGTRLNRINVPNQPAGLNFSPDGNYFYQGNNSTNIRVYELSTAYALDTVLNENTISFPNSGISGEVETIIFNDNKLYVTTDSDDTTVYVYTYNDFSLSGLNLVETITPSYDFDFFNISDDLSYVFFGSDASISDGGRKITCVGITSFSAFHYHTAITSTSTNTEFWTDINSMMADDSLNDGAVYYAVSTDDRTTWSIIDDTVTNGTEEFSVTVATGELYQNSGTTGNVFYIEDNENPILGLTRGNTYIFDQSDSSNSNHPLRFQLPDGTSYTNGITVNGTPGTSGANTTFVVPTDAPDDLEYYCFVHGIGMGGPINVYDLKNTRDIARFDSGQWYVNSATDYLTEIWSPATANDEFSALEEAAGVTGTRPSSSQVISDITYDNISLDHYSAASFSGRLEDITFSTDGIKMFVTDGAGTSSDNQIFQYNLSTAFDVSTASYSGNSYNPSNESNNPTSAYFKPDGTKMYINANGGIFEYNLSTAFDITTVAYTGRNLNIDSYGLFFNNNGTKFFVFDLSSNIIEYSLQTAWDISTATDSGKSFSVLSNITIPYNMVFSDGGYDIYITDSNGNVFVYTLDIPYDITTALYTGITLDYSSQGTNGRALAISNDESKLYIGTSGGGTVYQYSTTVNNLIETVFPNGMNSTQLNAVSNANHYTLGNDLDLAITLFVADGNTNSPTSDGVSINYDGNASSKSAIPGTDYTYDLLDSSTLRFKALSDENFSIRVT